MGQSRLIDALAKRFFHLSVLPYPLRTHDDLSLFWPARASCALIFHPSIEHFRFEASLGWSRGTKPFRTPLLLSLPAKKLGPAFQRGAVLLIDPDSTAGKQGAFHRCSDAEPLRLLCGTERQRREKAIWACAGREAIYIHVRFLSSVSSTDIIAPDHAFRLDEEGHLRLTAASTTSSWQPAALKLLILRIRAVARCSRLAFGYLYLADLECLPHLHEMS